MYVLDRPSSIIDILERGVDGKVTTHPFLCLSCFLTVAYPLVQLSFSSQPSAAAKIKDDGYNFHVNNTGHSPAKTAPALQTTDISLCNRLLNSLKVLIIRSSIQIPFGKP